MNHQARSRVRDCASTAGIRRRMRIVQKIELQPEEAAPGLGCAKTGPLVRRVGSRDQAV